MANPKFHSLYDDYETLKIGIVGYQGKEFKEIKPPKNNNKLEAKIEYFED